jgi:hypothetical protein
MPFAVPFGIVIDKPAMPPPVWFTLPGNNPALGGRFREGGLVVQVRVQAKYRPDRLI